jgi:hypothetical protein
VGGELKKLKIKNGELKIGGVGKEMRCEIVDCRCLKNIDPQRLKTPVTYDPSGVTYL